MPATRHPPRPHLPTSPSGPAPTGSHHVTTDLTRSTAAALADLLVQGDVSAREVTQAHLDRTAAVDGDVHSYLHVDTEGALAQADEVDRRRSAGESLHRLASMGEAQGWLTTEESITIRKLAYRCSFYLRRSSESTSVNRD